MFIVPMSLREKTQNRVLGWNAGVPCEGSIQPSLTFDIFNVLNDDFNDLNRH